MREEIKKVTVDLLTRHGYGGFRFADAADILNITRANIHYHFGNKEKLCEETILDHIAGAIANYERMLLNEETSFDEKIDELLTLNRRRYLQYNPDGKTGNSWALISRMRLEKDLLTESCRKALALFRQKLEENIVRAIGIAIERNELVTDTPAEELSLLLVAIINSSDATTRDTLSFDRMEQLYNAYRNLVIRCYGAR